MPVQLNGQDQLSSFGDVEDGVWTPVLLFATAGDSSIILDIAVGAYTKTGNKVTVSFNARTSTFTHTTASGSLQMSGLPFTSGNVTNRKASGPLTWTGATLTTDGITCQVNENASLVVFIRSLTAAAFVNLTTAHMPTGGTVQLIGSLTYFI